MNYKYIALANFTANINGEHRVFKPGDEVVLPSRHPELDLYINSKDLREDNYKKAGYLPIGFVAIEKLEKEKKEKKLNVKNN